MPWMGEAVRKACFADAEQEVSGAFIVAAMYLRPNSMLRATRGSEASFTPVDRPSFCKTPFGVLLICEQLTAYTAQCLFGCCSATRVRLSPRPCTAHNLSRARIAVGQLVSTSNPCNSSQIARHPAASTKPRSAGAAVQYKW